MEIREVYRDELGRLGVARGVISPDFPGRDSLLKLRESPYVLMPVAVVEREIVGFAVAKVMTVRRGRLGRVLYLASLVGEGPVERAIKAALLSRLEQKFRNLEADEIELPADQPPEFIDQLQKAGYRIDAGNAGRSHSLASCRRVVKLLKASPPPWVRVTSPGRDGKGVVE